METLDLELPQFVKMNFVQAMQQVRDDASEREYIFFIESLEVYHKMQQTFCKKVSCVLPSILKSGTSSGWLFPVLVNIHSKDFYGGYMNASNNSELFRSIHWYDSHRNVAKYIIPTFESFQACGISELF